MSQLAVRPAIRRDTLTRGKADFQSVAFRPTALTWMVSRGGWTGTTTGLRQSRRECREVGIFDVEETFLVQIVRLAAQCSPDDLLAESCVPKARTPSTWVTVLASQPSVSMATETTQRMSLAKAAFLPDGVHDLPQDLLVVDFFGLTCRPLRSTISRRNCSISSAAFRNCHLGLARFELFAVDQECARAEE